MIAVTDTSPISYLILIGEVELLPKLFSQVLVPHAVIAELLHDDAPEAVRSWHPTSHPGLPSERVPPAVPRAWKSFKPVNGARSCWHNRCKPI
jgi:hypothetical protein